jgi:outer membrane murein-binding lipoprotein Lpp
MIAPVEALEKLDRLATELGELGSKLASVERDLEPVENDFTRFVDDFELGLYARSVNEDGFKLPSEALRQKLAIQAMPPELYGRRTALVRSRDRLLQRIRTLKTEVEAQRSILSALKEEASASGSYSGRRFDNVSPGRAA